MRIADNMNYGQVNRNISKNRSEAADLQNQAASQKRVNKPSDDAVATVKALETRTEIANLEQHLRSIGNAKTFLDLSDQTLGELSDYLLRAKELAVQQSSSASSTPQTRQAVAGEIDQIFNQAVQIGNKKVGDRFLFGGYKTMQAPFNPVGEYKGDTGQIMVEVGKGSFVPMNIPGNFIFMGDKLRTRATVDEQGSVPQTVSQLENAIQREEADPGPTREKAPEGVRNQKLQEQSGPTMRGPASVEGPHEPGQVEENSGYHEKQMGENIFGVLSDLSIGLRTNDPTTIQSTLERLDVAMEQVVLARSLIGTRQSAVQAQMESLQKFNVDSKARLSILQDADVFQVYSDLNKNENTLKATMASGGKLVQMSLLDFLR